MTAVLSNSDDDVSVELTFGHAGSDEALEIVAEQQRETVPGMDPAWFSVDRPYRFCCSKFVRYLSLHP
jgi:hypothetical protein